MTKTFWILSGTHIFLDSCVCVVSYQYFPST